MNTVFKYPLSIDTDTSEVVINLPEEYEVLCIDTQDECPYVWCLVNTDNPTIPVIFKIYGTGYKIEEDPKTIWYIGTFTLLNKRLVYHVFEVVEPY